MPDISFGMAMPAFLPPDRQVRLATLLEWLGFDRLWFPDHMLYPELSPAPDAWSVITAAAMQTRRIQLGTAVSDPHRVHPAVFAQRLATIDQLSKGRVILGLGSGEAMNLDPYGIPWERRVGRVRESVQVLRGLLDDGEPFTFEGEFFQLRNARLCVRPWKGRRLPIYMAALGPLMQKVAAAHADGWIPTAIPVEHYAHYLRPLRDAVVQAGRDPGAFEPVAVVPVALCDDRRAAAAFLSDLMRRFALILLWPPVLERMGMRFEPPAHLAGSSYLTVNPCDADSIARYRELQAWVTEDLVTPFVLTGNVAEVRRGLAAYVEAGATSFNIYNVSPDPFGATVRLATEVIPYFTGRRGTLAARGLARALPVLRKTGLIERLIPKRVR